jgi:hypothetical protein
LADARVEDTARLIEGIVATEMGPEIPPIQVEDEMMVIEDDSE